MGKSTSVKSKSKGSDPLTKVKNAGVTKPADSPKAKSKKVAKEIATKGVKDDKKKKSKKPEPESESESSESSEDSEEDSEDSSDESSEDEKPAKKATASASAKKAAVAKKADSDSEDSDDSDSSSEEEEKPKAKAVKTNGAGKESSDSNSDSSDSDSDDEEEEKPAAKANGKKEESSDSDSSDSDEEEEEGGAKAKASSDSDSDSDSSDSDEEEEEKPKEVEEPVKKRKALDDPVIPSKKARTENTSEESATLFVGSLAWAVNDDILYQAYAEFPDLVSARVITDREGGRSRGFGYVDFANRDAAAKALEATQGKELEGRAMNVDFSDARPARSDNPRERADNRAQRHGDAVSPESDTLFVGNLSFDIDQESVREFFASAAEVTGVRLPTDPESGNLKGFGYVTFSSIEEAKSAFGQLNGQYLGEGRASRAVRLDYAGARPPRDGGGRGGFGGRGGGRGGPRGGGGRGGPGGRGGRGGGRGGFSSTNRGGMGDFSGSKITF